MLFKIKYKNPVLLVLLALVFLTLENVPSSAFANGDPLAVKQQDAPSVRLNPILDSSQMTLKSCNFCHPNINVTRVHKGSECLDCHAPLGENISMAQIHSRPHQEGKTNVDGGSMIKIENCLQCHHDARHENISKTGDVNAHYSGTENDQQGEPSEVENAEAYYVSFLCKN